MGDLVGQATGRRGVSSVALTVPNILSVAGSPITDAGTLAVTLATQNANLIFAGPSSGGAAAPTFRSLVVGDIPVLDDTRLANAVILAPTVATRNVIILTDSATNTVVNVVTLDHDSSGTPAAAFGTGLLLRGKSSTTSNREMGRVRTEWTTATDASRASKMVLSAYAIGVETDVLTLLSSGNVGIGNTNPTYKLDITSSSAGASLFRAVRAATSRGFTVTSDGQTIWTSSLTTDDGLFQFNHESSLSRSSSSGLKATAVRINIGLAPTTGSDENIAVAILGTVNQTGGTGITRGLVINQTVTAAVDYRAFEVVTGKAIFGGNVGVGVSAPSSKVDVAGDVEIGSANYFYLGDPTTDGSWRIGRRGHDLVSERRESEAWVTKQTITP